MSDPTSRKAGTSLGAIFSKEALARSKAKEGDTSARSVKMLTPISGNYLEFAHLGLLEIARFDDRSFCHDRPLQPHTTQKI